MRRLGSTASVLESPGHDRTGQGVEEKQQGGDDERPADDPPCGFEDDGNGYDPQQKVSPGDGIDIDEPPHQALLTHHDPAEGGQAGNREHQIGTRHAAAAASSGRIEKKDEGHGDHQMTCRAGHGVPPAGKRAPESKWRQGYRHPLRYSGGRASRVAAGRRLHVIGHRAGRATDAKAPARRPRA